MSEWGRAGCAVGRAPGWATALAWGLLAFSCAPVVETGLDDRVTVLGSAEVTAELLEIPGPFPANDLYDYAYVFQYRVTEVHRGDLSSGETVFVAHYNPLKPRAGAGDEFSGIVGGNVRRFRSGEIHRLALDQPLDLCYMGGIIDKYFEQKGTRYWALWTNRVRK